MPMPTPNEAVKMLTPDGLTNQLFDGAWKQNPKDPQLAARQVIDFLASALLFALKSSKNDPVVFLTGALIDVIGFTAEDENARKELLTHISGILTQAAQQVVQPPAQPPTATQQPPSIGKKP
jgi:hypothetical protein